MTPSASRLADVATAVGGVAGLHGGVFGEVATYLPGERVRGVAIGDDLVKVHIAVYADQDLRAVAAAVRDAVAAETDMPVQVTVEDVVMPEGQ